MPLIACAHCSASFTAPPSTNRKFCSLNCHYAASRCRIDLICDACGEPFETTPFYVQDAKRRGLKGNFCSRRCSGLFHRRYADKICPTCGNQFHPRTSESIYCSKACFDIAQTGKPQNKPKLRITKVCAQCGVEVEFAPTLVYRKYCSMACYAASKIGKPANVGATNGQWRGGVTPENKRIRKSREYDIWRKAVFERDDYTCQKCHQRGGTLRAHHLYRFAIWPNLRFVIENGHTLCDPCHSAIQWSENDYLIELGLDPAAPPW